MKTYQEFVTEALMARPSLVPASLNKPQSAAVQNAQKSIVKRPVPATQSANNTPPAAAAGTPRTAPTATAPAAAAGTKRPSLMQQAQELRAMRMRSMQRQGNTAGASAIRKTLPTAVAGASDQRAQQLNRVRNQARSATIANARGGQGMMQRSPVVQQQQRPAAAAAAGTGTVPPARPVVQQQQRPVPPARPTATPTAAAGTPTSKKPDIFTDTPVGGKPYGNAARPVVQQQRKPQVGDKVTDPEILKMIDQEREIGRTGRMPTSVKPKFRDEDLFTGQKLNPNTGKPIQQQPKFRDEPLWGPGSKTPDGKPSPTLQDRDEPLWGPGSKPAPTSVQQKQQQQNNGRVVNDAGVTRVTDPSTTEINVIKRRSPQEQQRIKSALELSGGSTSTPAANAASASNSKLSDDMIGKAFAARKATMMRGDGGEYSSDVWGETPEKFRATFNSLPPNRQRAILRRLSL